jgi:hypothetical protein
VGKKIEITPEMIEAAIDALTPYLSARESISNIARMAEAVLMAAQKVALCEKASEEEPVSSQ